MTEDYEPEDLEQVVIDLRKRLQNIIEFCNTLRGRDPWSAQMSRWFMLAEGSDSLRKEYTVAWDGEPKMGGGHHRQQMGAFRDLDAARAGRDLVLSRSKRAPKPNLRIEQRWVGPWTAA